MMDQMDAAAVKAAEVLSDLFQENPEAVSLVAEWWALWYMSAGHKRLGRLLVDIHKHPPVVVK